MICHRRETGQRGGSDTEALGLEIILGGWGRGGFTPSNVSGGCEVSEGKRAKNRCVNVQKGFP